MRKMSSSTEHGWLQYGNFHRLVIRHETPGDIDTIHAINTQAFGREAEAVIVDRLRKRGVLTISLVAIHENLVIGHIAFNPVTVESSAYSFEAIILAPVAILPAYQRKGVGSQLIKAGLEECRRLGHEVVVLVGHADYYPRFGFVPAGSKSLECEYEAPDEAWMVLELREGALAGRKGKVKFQPEFKDAV